MDGVDERGPRVLSKTLTRARRSELMPNLSACTVAMEACGRAHDGARQFRPYGNESLLWRLYGWSISTGQHSR